MVLGGSLAVVLGSGLFLATILLLRGGDVVGPTLSLLGNYFLGFHVTWAGAFAVLGEAAIGSFLFGYLLATAINLVIGWHETTLLLKLSEARDPLTEETP